MSDTGRHIYLGDRFLAWLGRPQHALRIEIVRIGAPLAILGFMSSRIAHADEWIGNTGFRVPELASPDYRQPMYLPPLPGAWPWIVAAIFVASGLALSVGFRSRIAALVFSCAALWCALADRLAAFSVSKLAPMVGIALALAPCGARWGIDAWRSKKEPPAEVASGSMRFFQVLLPVIYGASGIAKARGDWLSHDKLVLWTHLHDSYQTWVTVLLANALPPIAWTIFQLTTLAFELFAPIWFAWKKTRGAAFVYGVGMHAMIGLMFGPVRYFAMLMATLLVASYIPDRWLITSASASLRARS